MTFFETVIAAALGVVVGVFLLASIWLLCAVIAAIVENIRYR